MRDAACAYVISVGEDGDVACGRARVTICRATGDPLCEGHMDAHALELGCRPSDHPLMAQRTPGGRPPEC